MNKLLDMLLEFSKENPKSSYIYSEQYSKRNKGIAGELGMPFDGELEGYFSQGLLTWYCRDGEYGLKAHYFDNKLLAISLQWSGEDEECFNWLSREAQKTFAKFLATDKSIGKSETNHLKKLKGRLERALAYVTHKIDSGDYECPLIVNIDLEKLILSIINGCRSYARKYNIGVWDKMENYMRFKHPNHFL